jgi:hypothetical protein
VPRVSAAHDDEGTYDAELEQALDWLDVELPPHSTRSTRELLWAAERVGIGSDVLRRALDIVGAVTAPVPKGRALPPGRMPSSAPCGVCAEAAFVA